jgi:hypothetical protein
MVRLYPFHTSRESLKESHRERLNPKEQISKITTQQN